MTDYYSINVSKNSKYLFETEGGYSGLGITKEKELHEIMSIFNKKFPKKKDMR